MQDVFVIEALRTPFGSLGGALASITAPRLAATVIEALVRRSGVDAARVDEVVVGQVLPAGVGQAPARQAMRLAGLPDEIPATTINKVCGSGLAAMQLAAMSIRTGAAEVAVAGGMESMSLAPYLLARARQGYRLGNGDLLDGLVHDGLRDAYDGRHMARSRTRRPLATASAARSRTRTRRARTPSPAARSRAAYWSRSSCRSRRRASGWRGTRSRSVRASNVSPGCARPSAPQGPSPPATPPR